jgi:hypothetical protein
LASSSYHPAWVSHPLALLPRLRAADSTVGIVDFYNARFNIGLSQDDKNDLVRFLEAH